MKRLRMWWRGLSSDPPRRFNQDTSEFFVLESYNPLTNHARIRWSRFGYVQGYINTDYDGVLRLCGGIRG